MEVKVSRKNKWKTAIIKKIHRNGTYKVLYKKDGLTESKIPIERLGLTNSSLEGKYFSLR